MSHRILIADGLAKEGLERLRQIPQVELLEHDALPKDQLEKLLPETDILIVRSRTQVNADLLSKSKRLKLVIRAGIGLDNIDVAAATQNAVIVMNAPTGNIVTTAEHALALLFAVSRHVAAADSSLRKGKWEKKKFQGHEIRGKTLGLVGLGNIGKAVAERAMGLGLKVLSFDPYLSAEAAARLKVELVDLDTLCAQSDYISIHVPFTPATKHLFNQDRIRKMKKGAYLINCARGGIVDETALIEALSAKHLTGAALDVFETEPLPTDHPLLQRDDVVITPHLGASTDEAQVQVGLEVAEQVTLYVQQGALRNAINVPNIAVDQIGTVKPYLTLCERLGGFASQMTSLENTELIRISYKGLQKSGNISSEILTLSVIKGFLSPHLSTPVNFVNARLLAKERGLRIEESFEDEAQDYSNLIEVQAVGKHSTKVTGTLFGRSESRIVKVDDYTIEAIPQGHLLYTENTDQPGVVGSIGTLLGSRGINIAGMHLGRDPKKGKALALISVDSAPSEEILNALRKTSGMLTVRPLYLP